jgi:hypothetical protein
MADERGGVTYVSLSLCGCGRTACPGWGNVRSITKSLELQLPVPPWLSASVSIGFPLCISHLIKIMSSHDNELPPSTTNGLCVSWRRSPAFPA